VASAVGLPTVTIKSCYDGDICTTSRGEKIQLASLHASALKGKSVKPALAMAAKGYLNGMLMQQTVGIRRITRDGYGPVGRASGHAEIDWNGPSCCPWRR